MQRSAIVICRLSVRRLSVTRVYCDKTAEARIIQFSLKYSPCLNSLPAKFDSEIQRSPLDRGAQTGVGVFDRVRDAISRKQGEMELIYVTINKSYVGFRLQQHR